MTVLQSLDHVLMFVPSVRDAADWYASVVNSPARYFDDRFACISIGSAQLCFHHADAKVPAGRAGQVAYWRVESLDESARRFQNAGAKLYRGPLAIESGMGICQLADPFGNLIGLVGQYCAA